MFSLLKRPLLFAHRGASATHPENTLEAFEAAVRAGADVLELDLHESRDGHAMVHHDTTLGRTTDGNGPLAAKTLKQLKALDAGRGYPGETFAGQGIRIPTLDEVLDRFPKTALNIEFKVPRQSLIERALELIDHRDPETVLLTAGRVDTMRMLQRLQPKFPLGMSRMMVWEAMFRARAGLSLKKFRGRALQIPPRSRGIPVATHRLIRAAQRDGAQVHIWTINRPDQAQHWLDLGVDGIMTDHPAFLRPLFEASRVSPSS